VIVEGADVNARGFDVAALRRRFAMLCQFPETQ
jgi:ABC-type phosphate transport system ATPase subunit